MSINVCTFIRTHIHTSRDSYRQARSLQHHALQSQQDQDSDSSLLYYYSLDFRGEACALHGATLERQATFVHRALKAIAARHSGSEATTTTTASVLVVGHSYGGMVAKAGVARVLAAAIREGREGGKHLQVPALLTLGTPHQR